jgi:hypothetical protein
METQLTQKEIARAMTNDPALSEVSFTLGDRTYKVVDLAYDDYTTFLSLLSPLIEGVAKKFISHVQVVDSGENFSLRPTDLFDYCKNELPKLVAIICNQTDQSITEHDVKAVAKSPIQLAQIVMLQFQQNNIIKDIGDFFVQTLPLIKAAMGAMSGTRSSS